MDSRALTGLLQLLIAGVGAMILLFSIWLIVTIRNNPGNHVDDWMLIFAAVAVLIGLVLVATGLLIPPDDRFGVRFTRRQRYLFLVSIVAAAGTVVVPFVTLTVGVFSFQTGYYLSAGLLVVAVSALLGGILWRIGASVARRYERRR